MLWHKVISLAIQGFHANSGISTTVFLLENAYVLSTIQIKCPYKILVKNVAK